MNQRFDVAKTIPAGYHAMLGVHEAVQGGGLEIGLLELVRLRVSQINGCAFCVAMHVPIAREHGVSELQTHLLATWQEAPVFDVRQRAALGYAEALTTLDDQAVGDAVYRSLDAVFSTAEIGCLTLCIAEINAWNRLMVASRTPPTMS